MIRVGIIGLGKIAFSYSSDLAKLITHAQVISVEPDFDLAFGVDPNPVTRKIFSEKFGVPSFCSVEEADSVAIPDLYVISSPTDSLSDNLQLVSHRKPKAILLEKPAAFDLQEATEYRNLKNLKDTRVFVNYQRNYHPQFLSLAKKISALPTHEPLHLAGNFFGEWRNTGSHLVSLTQNLIGNREVPISNIRRNQHSLYTQSPNFSIQIQRFEESEGSFLNLSIITKSFHVKYESSFDRLEYFRFGHSKVFKDEICLIEEGERIILNEPECIRYVYRNIAESYKGNSFFESNLDSAIRTLEWIEGIDN